MVSIHLYDGDSNEAVEDLRRGIEIALDDIGAEFRIPDFTGVRGFYEDNIKINKISYRAIEHFRLPIIRTWYRYGQFEPYKVLRPKQLEISPATPSDRTTHSREYYNPPSREEIAGFLIESGLREIWEQDLFDFLRDNYQEFAPEKHKQEYLINTGILEVLEEIEQDDSLETNAEKHREQFKEYSMDLRYEIDTNPRFDEEIHDHVESFLYFFEDALIALEELEEPSSTQLHAVRRGRNIYHEYVWTLPAMVISRQEARGPDQEMEEFERLGKKQLDEFKSTFPNRLNDWKQEIIELGLKPDTQTYRSVKGPASSTLGQLEKATLGTNE